MSAIPLLLIIVIALTSYVGIRNPAYEERYIFDVDRILIDKQYYRLISSGFLHANWYHLAFNIVAIYSFGKYCISIFGVVNFFVLYFSSLIGGNLLSLYVHRNHGHGEYRALGASGAGFGLSFATIVYDPFSEISFFFMSDGIDAWIIGSLLIFISIIGVKRQVGNIGHDAHLGGAIVGMLLTLAFAPQYMLHSPWTLLLLGIPSIGFVIFIIKNPSYLMVDSFAIKPHINSKHLRVETSSKEEEVNRILDKINKKGYDKLTAKEKAKLEQLSKK